MRAKNIHGEIVQHFHDKQYLRLASTGNTVYEIEEIESPAIEGCRIIKYVYRLYTRFSGIVEQEYRYGLLNEDNKLITSSDYTLLSRLPNGNISAEYPSNSYSNKAFECILTTRGMPLFSYNEKKSDGQRIAKYCVLDNADAVSKCYYGIARFAKDHLIGIIDYKGNILLDAEYKDIEFDLNNNCFITIQHLEDSFLASPAGSRNDSHTYILSQNKNLWPLSFMEINDNYYVDKFYETHAIYKLKNKSTNLVCLGIELKEFIITDEYKEIELAYERENDSIFIAKNLEGKYGCICISEEIIDENTGESIYKQPEIVCQFVYDYMHQPVWGRKGILIISKNGRDGLFSCVENNIIMECTIPSINGGGAIMTNSLNEGYVGCKKVIDDKGNFLHFFADMNGNVVLELPNRFWSISGGFSKGLAKITSKTEYATIDLNGHITITGKKRQEYYEDSWSDYDSMYRDAFENDPGAEWNVL